MKIEWTKETTTRVASNIVIVAAGILLYFLFSSLPEIWQGMQWLLGIIAPFLCGIVLAFLLAAPTHFFEGLLTRYCFRRKARPGLARALGITITMIVTIAVLTLIFYAIIPQLGTSVRSLIDNMPDYMNSFNQFIEQLLARLGLDSSIFEQFIGSWQEIIQKAGSMVGDALPHVYTVSKQITSGITTFAFGFIISIYLLASKEKFIAQLKKALFALFPAKYVTAAVRLARYTGHTFSKYISGQLLDALILGVLCFICMTIFRLDYALLISFIIAITNIIPFFGPVIGAIPCAFILLMIQPVKALWFIILIIVLQQIDGNLLSPRIVGKSTGLPAFWVLFAIFVGGGLFGFFGIILGVPAFSVIYVLVRHALEKRLEKKNLPIATECYNESDRAL